MRRCGLSRALLSLCCLGFPLGVAVPAAAGITQAGADLRPDIAAPGQDLATGTALAATGRRGQLGLRVQCEADEIDFAGPFAAAIAHGVVQPALAYRGTSFAYITGGDPAQVDTGSDLHLAPWVSCLQQLAGLQGFSYLTAREPARFGHGRVVDPASYRRRNRD